ncbi:MAG: ATP-binding protein, partial [Candidatus Binatia bacterium]
HLDDPATREREVRALLAATAEHPHAKLYLIMLTLESAHGMPEQVVVHPAAQWFLSADSSEGGT